MLAFGVMMFGATATGEPTTCEAHKKSVLEDIEKSGGGVGAYIPQCTENGDYEPKQCHQSTGMCWCVNEAGVEVPFSRPEEEHGKTNFPCDKVRSVDDTECSEEAIQCMIDKACPALVSEWWSDEREETTAACNENSFCKTWLECYESEIARRRMDGNEMCKQKAKRRKKCQKFASEGCMWNGEECIYKGSEDRTAFNSIDTNNDGSITFAEYAAAQDAAEDGCVREVAECYLNEDCRMVLDGFREGEELECWYHSACINAFSCYAQQHDSEETCASEAADCAVDTECSPWVHTVDDDVQEDDAEWLECVENDACVALMECAALDGPNATPVAPIKAAMKNHLKMATVSMLQSCPSCQED